jgi:PadR family transcriptional regulator
VADRRFSAQTLSLLGAPETNPTDWRHGYELSKETGLRSGTLYPMLIRVADRGLVEAIWEEEQPARTEEA